MNPEPTTQLPAIPPLSSSDLLGWLRSKLADAERIVMAREQMDAAWRGGSDESWKSVGCKLNKSARLKESSVQGRIATKCRHDVSMFKAAIDALSHPNKKVSEPARKPRT
jgi:hypothetical protein